MLGALLLVHEQPGRERLVLLAERAARLVCDVPPAKRLEDELEVLEAVRAVTTVSADALPAALGAVAECAAAALSCEFAAVATVPRDGSDPVCSWAGPGWSPAREALVAQAAVSLIARRAELPLLIQDSAAEDAVLALEGFEATDGITAMQALPVGADPVAVLFVAHASTVPRGFTLLCRRVAGAMADAAEAVVRRAIAQERLAAENSELAKRVETDALTGVASRSWWEERLACEPAGGAAPGRFWSVVVVDLDGLKQLNDTRGHGVGDELLRDCAQLLQRNCRAGDRVARIGGDEFVVLLQDAGSETAARWFSRLLDAAQDLGAVDLADDDLRDTEAGHRERHAPAVAVEHRQRVQVDVAVGHAGVQRERHGVGPDVAVRDLHALGPCGRPRRVVDRRGRVLVGLPRRRFDAHPEQHVVAGLAEHEAVRRGHVGQGLVELRVDQQHRGFHVTAYVATGGTVIASGAAATTPASGSTSSTDAPQCSTM